MKTTKDIWNEKNNELKPRTGFHKQKTIRMTKYTDDLINDVSHSNIELKKTVNPSRVERFG